MQVRLVSWNVNGLRAVSAKPDWSWFNRDTAHIIGLQETKATKEQLAPEILDILLKYGIRRCYYGHIHGAGCSYAFNGSYMGIDFRLISADYLRFDPVLVETPG